MQGLLPITCCSLLLLSAPTTQASVVFRCEDPQGHITYTLQGCPSDQHLELQEAYNPPPGNDQPVAMAKPLPTTKSGRKSEKPSTGLTVVGEKQDGCGNRITGSQRRTAMIRQEVRSGMTKADVESSLGRPDKVTHQDGKTRYHYSDDQGNKRSVTFDEAGCVKGKR